MKPILKNRILRLHRQVTDLQAELDSALAEASRACNVKVGAIVVSMSNADPGRGAQMEVMAVRTVVGTNDIVEHQLVCQNPMDEPVTISSHDAQVLRAAPADGIVPTWHRADLPRPGGRA